VQKKKSESDFVMTNEALEKEKAWYMGVMIQLREWYEIKSVFGQVWRARHFDLGALYDSEGQCWARAKHGPCPSSLDKYEIKCLVQYWFGHSPRLNVGP
ncbi:hypothetical protein H5410_016072, partial [Solanum commersonii]